MEQPPAPSGSLPGAELSRQRGCRGEMRGAPGCLRGRRTRAQGRDFGHRLGRETERPSLGWPEGAAGRAGGSEGWDPWKTSSQDSLSCRCCLAGWGPPAPPPALQVPQQNPPHVVAQLVKGRL